MSRWAVQNSEFWYIGGTIAPWYLAYSSPTCAQISSGVRYFLSSSVSNAIFNASCMSNADALTAYRYNATTDDRHCKYILRAHFQPHSRAFAAKHMRPRTKSIYTSPNALYNDAIKQTLEVGICSSFPPRQIHLDFHTSEYIDGIAAQFDPDEFARTAKAASVSSITVFARCHHGWLYYDSKRFPERVHPHLKNRNLLVEQVRALHSQGIKAPVYITVQWDYQAPRRILNG